MASVHILTEPLSIIDYSLADRRVRSFELRGAVLYDEDESIAVDGWEDELVDFVRLQELDIDYGEGLHAFVYGLIEKGLLPA